MVRDLLDEARGDGEEGLEDAFEGVAVEVGVDDLECGGRGEGEGEDGDG